ncbi:putative nuclease HARBI1 [Anneissia japonica]|uniref:putative nuclease HARBI1 n=1 Tax=Anneissia japonica TaxID=1529436 RepID=UPI001425A5EA|nr:putative nuclease HARBI1 [Anneissia japonica]
MIAVEICVAIWKRLSGIYMAMPSSAEEWMQLSRKFHMHWNYPNALGAVDGKHVHIKAPNNSGSQYFCYKGHFSIVLLALVDANYCFTYIDVGNYGSASDGGIFARSALAEARDNGKIKFPGPKCLSNAPELGEMPHVILGDEAFPLNLTMMRPFPGKELTDQKRICNYRHSRGRRISENAFGQLCARFIIFFRIINLSPKNIDHVIKATCVLHNFLKKTSTVERATQRNTY